MVQTKIPLLTKNVKTSHKKETYTSVFPNIIGWGLVSFGSNVMIENRFVTVPFGSSNIGSFDAWIDICIVVSVMVLVFLLCVFVVCFQFMCVWVWCGARWRLLPEVFIQMKMTKSSHSLSLVVQKWWFQPHARVQYTYWYAMSTAYQLRKKISVLLKLQFLFLAPRAITHNTRHL